MNTPPEPRKPYWTLVSRDRYHTYYVPATNTPGILLFALFDLAGAVALAVGVHRWAIGTAVRQDYRLIWIGGGLMLLATYQMLKLLRARRSAPGP